MKPLSNNSVVLICFVFISSSVTCQINQKFNYDINSKNFRRHLLSKGDDDSITYPEDVPNEHRNENFNMIPLDLIEKLNNVPNMAEFLNQFIDMDTMDSREAISTRFAGEEDVERSAGISAKPATCIPQQTVVSLVPEDNHDPNVIYFPTCTRMNRCGGCCTHDLLECQPIEVEKRTFQIFKTQYNGRSKFAYNGKEIVIRDEHMKCKCDCRIKETDCKPFQKYDKSQCNCICTNIDDKTKCIGQNDTKIWDPSNCVCRCREGKECTTGSYFDENKCTCLEIPLLLLNSKVNNQQILDRKRFIVKAIPVAQTDQTIYNTAGVS